MTKSDCKQSKIRLRRTRLAKTDKKEKLARSNISFFPREWLSRNYKYETDNMITIFRGRVASDCVFCWRATRTTVFVNADVTRLQPQNADIDFLSNQNSPKSPH